MYVCQEGDLIPQGDCVIVLYCIENILLGTVPWSQPRLIKQNTKMFVLILVVVWFSPLLAIPVLEGPRLHVLYKLLNFKRVA